MPKYTEAKHQKYRSCFEKLPAEINAVVFDFDGVFTDNKVTVSQDGVESVVCSRGDGLAVGIFQKNHPNIPLIVISKERNPVVVQRCKKLNLQCLHGVDNKLPLLQQWLSEKGLKIENTVYLGNDLNDLECIAAVGCGVSVADGYTEVLDVADLILENAGGNNAVRELLEIIGLYLSSTSI